MPLTLTGGFLGVDIFFALSGYLITRLLLLEYEQNQRINLLKFYLRRWFRLGPALLAMLLFYGLTVWLFSPGATLNNQGVDILLASLYLTNWARALLLKQPEDLGHTWSLAVEEQFYIVWPLLLWLLLRTLGPKYLLLLAIVALAASSWGTRLFLFYSDATVSRLYNGLDTRAETIMWGAALAVWTNIPKNTISIQNKGTKVLALTAVSLACVFALLAGAEWASDWYYQYGITATAILAVIIIGYLHSSYSSIIKIVLSNRYLVWLGTVSYGLYLWHFPLYRLLLSLNIKDGWLLLAGSMITVPVAALSYYLLERPLLRYHSNKML